MPLARGYIHVLNHEKKLYKIRLQSNGNCLSQLKSGIGCMLGIVLCTKKMHSVRRKNTVL